MFKHHNSFFPYKAFYLKIKMNTENLVSDDYLIEIWGFKVCQYLPLGRNIGSRNFCSDNPPNTVPVFLCQYLCYHTCLLARPTGLREGMKDYSKVYPKFSDVQLRPWLSVEGSFWTFFNGRGTERVKKVKYCFRITARHSNPRQRGRWSEPISSSRYVG